MEDMIPQGSPAPHDGPGYEHSDVGIRGILIFGLMLTLVTVLTMAILGGWYAAMAARERSYIQSRPPRFAEDDAGQFPAPVLQAKPRTDMIALANEDRARLQSYGWVDEEAGIARIPIKRAMELALGQLNAPATVAPSTEPPPAPAPPSSEPEATPTNAPAGNEGQVESPVTVEDIE